MPMMSCECAFKLVSHQNKAFKRAENRDRQCQRLAFSSISCNTCCRNLEIACVVNSACSLLLTSSQDLCKGQFRQTDSAVAAVNTQSFNVRLSLCCQASLVCKVLLEDTRQKRLF